MFNWKWYLIILVKFCTQFNFMNQLTNCRKKKKKYTSTFLLKFMHASVSPWPYSIKKRFLFYCPNENTEDCVSLNKLQYSYIIVECGEQNIFLGDIKRSTNQAWFWLHIYQSDLAPITYQPIKLGSDYVSTNHWCVRYAMYEMNKSSDHIMCSGLQNQTNHIHKIKSRGI